MDDNEINFEKEIDTYKNILLMFLNNVNEELFGEKQMLEWKNKFDEIVSYYNPKYKPFKVGDIELVLKDMDKTYYEELQRLNNYLKDSMNLNNEYNLMINLLNMKVYDDNKEEFINKVDMFYSNYKTYNKNISFDLHSKFENKIFILLYKTYELEKELVDKSNLKIKTTIEGLDSASLNKVKLIAVNKLKEYAELFPNDEYIKMFVNKLNFEDNGILDEITSLNAKINSDNKQFNTLINSDTKEIKYYREFKDIRYVFFDDEQIKSMFNKKYFNGWSITLIYEHYSNIFSANSYNKLLSSYINKCFEEEESSDYDNIDKLIEDNIGKINIDNIELLKKVLCSDKLNLLYVINISKLLNKFLNKEEYNNILESSLTKINESPFGKDLYEMISKDKDKKITVELFERLKENATNSKKKYNLEAFNTYFATYIPDEDKTQMRV